MHRLDFSYARAGITIGRINAQLGKSWDSCLPWIRTEKRAGLLRLRVRDVLRHRHGERNGQTGADGRQIIANCQERTLGAPPEADSLLINAALGHYRTKAIAAIEMG